VYDIPTKEEEEFGYVGIATGVMPKIDSFAVDGAVSFSNKLTQHPNLCLGGQINAVENLDVRGAIHMPLPFGGFGMRAGPQFSFLNRESKFNVAIGSDLGYTFAKDSIKLFGDNIPLSIAVNGVFSADFFLPLRYSFNNESRLIVTPRYSYTTFYMRYNTERKSSYSFRTYVPSLAIGFRIKHFYFENSVFLFQDKYIVNYGFAYLF
jgi:hypothetical protein